MVRRGFGFGFEPAGCCCEKGGTYDAYCDCVLPDEGLAIIVDLSEGTIGPKDPPGDFSHCCELVNDVFAVDIRSDPRNLYECTWHNTPDACQGLFGTRNIISIVVYLKSTAWNSFDYCWHLRVFISLASGIGQGEGHWISKSLVGSLDDGQDCFDQFAAEDGRIEMTKVFFEPSADCVGDLPETLYLERG